MSKPAGCWVVLQETDRFRWGGDIRRAHVLADLARRSGAAVAGWRPDEIRAAIRAAGARRWFWEPRGRPWIATAELLPLQVIAEVPAQARPFALDVHDDPLLQRTVMQLPPLPADDQLVRRWHANLAMFPRLILTTASMGALSGIDADKVIVAPNGTDTDHIRPGPWPGRPVVGMISGAAAGRGIETLVEATRRARAQIADLELRLWLVATGEASASWLASLQADLSGETWIRIPGAVPYNEVGRRLSEATVLCVPNPPDAYWETVLPIKLFDGMAAGRPMVVTPRREMAEVVAATGAGIITAGDHPDDLAAAIVQLIEDEPLARRLGAAGRSAAETTYDWRVIASTLADQLLADPLLS